MLSTYVRVYQIPVQGPSLLGLLVTIIIEVTLCCKECNVNFTDVMKTLASTVVHDVRFSTAHWPAISVTSTRSVLRLSTESA